MMNALRTAFFLLFLCLIGESQAQQYVGLKTVEVNEDKHIDDEAIEELAFRLLNAQKDSTKKQLNQQLRHLLLKELNKKEAKTHDFSAIKSLSVLVPSDSSFKLFNWNIPYRNGTFDYECGILDLKTGLPEQFKFFSPLSKDSLNEESITEAYTWFPGLIYDIITTKNRFQTFYTLLMWDGNTVLTNRKRIDVISINKEGIPRFGAAIFKSNLATKTRVLFEYGNENKMILKYDETLNRIKFDHLSPPSSQLEGVYEYYGADLSFDAYDWNGDFWRYLADIDADKGSQKKKSDFKYDKKIIKKDQPIYSPN